MSTQNRKIILAIGGSSGAVYAQRLIHYLKDSGATVGVVMSENAVVNWELEIGPFSRENLPFTVYSKQDFNAPFASGSAQYDTMIVCPCSMGLLARMAGGLSTDLMTRAADVVLKERRKLIIVPRETPYNLIHLNNMKTLTEAGAVICPATPSFYSRPQTIEALVDTVVHRILDLASIEVDAYRWGKQK